jgi:hypothetical protein
METPPISSQVVCPLSLPCLEEPIPRSSRRDVIKVVTLGLLVAASQFALLIVLLGLSGHR